MLYGPLSPCLFRSHESVSTKSAPSSVYLSSHPHKSETKDSGKTDNEDNRIDW